MCPFSKNEVVHVHSQDHNSVLGGMSYMVLVTVKVKWYSWWYELDGVRDSDGDMMFVTAIIWMLFVTGRVRICT